MTDKKIRSAERMLDAVGGISDVFVTEAAEYRATRRTHGLIRRFELAAVCFALVLVIVSTSIAGVLIYNGLQEKAPSPDDPYFDDSNGASGTVTISSAMLSLKSSTETMRTDIKAVDLFDRTSRVIWKYTDETDYRVCSIDSSNATAISNGLKSRDGFTEVSEDNGSDSGLEGIWICFGDGLVYSPCLKESDGNIGFGRVFDYDPELEPSEKFSKLISETITAQQ